MLSSLLLSVNLLGPINHLAKGLPLKKVDSHYAMLKRGCAEKRRMETQKEIRYFTCVKPVWRAATQWKGEPGERMSPEA